MKARLVASVVLGFVLAGPTPGAAGEPAQLRGQIKAVRVIGEVQVARGPDQAPVALQNNGTLAPGDIVRTAKSASVVLVFSNGSTVNLGPESRLAIDEFLQDPFGAEIKVGDLKEEPSRSRTKLNLTYGELVGSVKRLRGASTFLVQTPVGAAGIRGTVFRLVYRPSGTGKAFFTLSTTAGEVIFQGPTGAPVAVGEDREILVDVKVDEATGAVQSVTVQSQTIAPEEKQIIEQQVTQAVESLRTTTFVSPAAPVNPAAPETTPAEEKPAAQEGAPAPPPPPPAPEPPRTTPGDGQAG
ncbi:MAG TPA: FecR family protein [Opitutaceae bacterium]|nr:FecR family protein [Opitutaceae bacterium]